ncbi:hypothetical protein GWI33_001759 [Rhynchophorus ferrugineus]|uniref:Uncharacterized protein n=1 Tax=Rhynchophorus ferrugineus TaxID=354439 RepID=A0A834IN92_RHYFE|nr:hypothetical protein GWI33_001759 [Rhynchophorus ferrugineus]
MEKIFLVKRCPTPITNRDDTKKFDKNAVCAYNLTANRYFGVFDITLQHPSGSRLADQRHENDQFFFSIAAAPDRRSWKISFRGVGAGGARTNCAETNEPWRGDGETSRGKKVKTDFQFGVTHGARRHATPRTNNLTLKELIKDFPGLYAGARLAWRGLAVVLDEIILFFRGPI